MSPDVARRVVRCSSRDLENAALHTYAEPAISGALLQRVKNFCMRVQFHARIAPRARGTASIRSAAVSAAVIPDRSMHPLSSIKRTRGGLSCEMRFYRRRQAEEREDNAYCRRLAELALRGIFISAGSNAARRSFGYRSAFAERFARPNRVQARAAAEHHGNRSRT